MRKTDGTVGRLVELANRKVTLWYWNKQTQSVILAAIIAFTALRIQTIGLKEVIITICSTLTLVSILLDRESGGNARRWCVWASLLSLAILIRFSYWNGIYGHDDFVYLNTARKMFHGLTENILECQWAVRYCIWFPMFFLYKVFEPSMVMAFVPTFLNSILEFLLVGAVCWGVFRSRMVVSLGLFLVAHYPLSAFTASTIRGDAESSVMNGLLLLAVVTVLRSREKRKDSNIRLVLLITGFIVLIGLWAKPTNIIAVTGFFLCVPYFLYTGVLRRKDLLFIFFGVLLWVAVEGAINLAAGVPVWNRYHWSFQTFTQQFETGQLINDPSMKFSYPIALLLDLPFLNRAVEVWHVNQYVSFSSWGWLLVAASTSAFLLIKGPWRFLPGWLLFTLLYMIFGTMSLQHYVPLHKEPRYFMLATVPWMALVAFYLTQVRKLGGRFHVLVGILCFLLVLSSLSILNFNNRKYTEHLKDIDLVEEEIKRHPDQQYFSKHYIIQYLELKTGFSRPAPEHRFPGEGGALSDLHFFSHEKCHDCKLIFHEPFSQNILCGTNVKRLVSEGRLSEDKCLGRSNCVYRIMSVK